MKKIKYFYDRNGYKRRLRKKNPVAGILVKIDDEYSFYTYTY